MHKCAHLSLLLACLTLPRAFGADISGADAPEFLRKAFLGCRYFAGYDESSAKSPFWDVTAARRNGTHISISSNNLTLSFDLLELTGARPVGMPDDWFTGNCNNFCIDASNAADHSHVSSNADLQLRCGVQLTAQMNKALAALIASSRRPKSP